jgi:acetyltransferase-like isoleucine patch superfamily enzyme
MRSDLRPYLLKKAAAYWNRRYAEHFLYPHLDAVGPGCRVINPRYFEVTGPNVSLGRDVHMMATRDNPVRFSVWTDGERSGRIVLGDYAIVLPGARVSSASSVVVGKNCMLASNCYVTDADWHDLYDRNVAPGGTSGVVLDDNVWLGDSVIVCKGVRIGENSIVGAGAVVVADVAPNVIVAGNPAGVVKTLDAKIGYTTRERLFQGSVPYEVFADEFDRQVLGENTFARWLRSKLMPDRAL